MASKTFFSQRDARMSGSGLQKNGARAVAGLPVLTPIRCNTIWIRCRGLSE